MAQSETMLENRQYALFAKVSMYMVANNVLK